VRSRVDSLVRRLRPEWVFHLAALSSVADSWADPAGTLINNVGAQANLLAAAARLDPQPRVLVVGSTDEYGQLSGRARALDEDTALRPVTPYGVSKVAQDFLAFQYFLSLKLPVVRVRAFNHTGPRQSPNFAIPSFARQLARIELGRQRSALRVGNLNVQRDFTDVRDMVRAYRLAIEKGKPGAVYNLGSGRAVSLRRILDTLMGMSRRQVRVMVDRALIRTVDPRAYICDARRFRRATGWRPRIPLEDTLRDTLEYWRRVEAAN
jgi:GDP-4-dehydro-6-deoxy-D-mannose reductase